MSVYIEEIIKVAKKILNEEINIIEGSRLISSLRHNTQFPDSTIFYAFRAVDSETENFLIEEAKKFADKEYLKKLDSEKEIYTKEMNEIIFDASQKLIKELTKLK
ncbi:MAG TPA: hypothetical protein VD999_02780 [Vitreimonas sp.]|nr:hypothetical protein [Vitreimonas sp.]